MSKENNAYEETILTESHITIAVKQKRICTPGTERIHGITINASTKTTVYGDTVIEWAKDGEIIKRDDSKIFEFAVSSKINLENVLKTMLIELGFA